MRYAKKANFKCNFSFTQSHFLAVNDGKNRYDIRQIERVTEVEIKLMQKKRINKLIVSVRE